MKSSRVQDVLHSMYGVRRELVPCFIGAPGIGKTQGIQEFARSKGVKMVTFILSTALPSEVSGIRMPDNDSKELEVFDDARMASLEDGDILFFDEILEAPPALWSACLTLIQDRMLASGRKLPNVMIVAASNPVSNPDIIPPSLRDRFQFIELGWDYDAWIDYMKERFGINKGADRFMTLATAIQQGLEEPSRYKYNTLTPRRVTKLVEWYVCADDKDFVLDSIRQMFDSHLAHLIEVIIVPDEKDRIMADVFDTLAGNFNIDFDGLKYYDLTPSKLFDIIEQLPAETKYEVQKYLEGVEYV